MRKKDVLTKVSLQNSVSLKLAFSSGVANYAKNTIQTPKSKIRMYLEQKILLQTANPL